MSLVLTHRLARTVRLEGVGVHTGEPCAATVGPADRFELVVGGECVPASLDGVTDAAMGVRIAGVRTIEHLLSALAGRGVFGARIEVEGGELPILDGSAARWCEALETESAGEVEPVAGPAEVRDGDRLVRLEPGPWRVVVELTDRGGLAALGPTRLELDPAAYDAEIAWARTFAWAPDVPRLLAAGFGRGANRENTVVVGEGATEGRGPGEPLRHKALDAIGDLALLGRPWRGTLTLRDSGHDLHIALARALAARG